MKPWKTKGGKKSRKKYNIEKDTYELSKLPKGHEAIKIQWTFKFKKRIDEKKVGLVHMKTRHFHFHEVPEVYRFYKIKKKTWYAENLLRIF